VSASGWYEWQKISPKAKRPYHFRPKAEPFAFAGVYDVWKGDGGRAITSFAIVTTDAAPSVAQYHNRMPVVPEDSQFDDWMRSTPDQAAALMKALCRRDRGVGSRGRSGQREEQPTRADGAGGAILTAGPQAPALSAD
jgi:putative SOS response-associated peptidase YedK